MRLIVAVVAVLVVLITNISSGFDFLSLVQSCTRRKEKRRSRTGNGLVYFRNRSADVQDNSGTAVSTRQKHVGSKVFIERSSRVRVTNDELNVVFRPSFAFFS